MVISVHRILSVSYGLWAYDALEAGMGMDTNRKTKPRKTTKTMETSVEEAMSYRPLEDGNWNVRSEKRRQL